MPDVPVLVVGGGPAGAVAALLLARTGCDVELVDRARFPRGKACGECVNPGGVRLLDRLGLLDRIWSDATPLRGWKIGLPGRKPAEGRFGGRDLALGVERAPFDRVLLDAARDAGVHVREGIRVVGASPGNANEPARAVLRLPDGREECRSARFLVGADGLHSRVGAAVGLAAPPRPPRKASVSWRVSGRGPPRDRGLLLLGPGITAGLAPVGALESERWNATFVVSGDRAFPPHPPTLGEAGWTHFLSFLDGWRSDKGSRMQWETGPERIEGPWASGSFHRPVRRPGLGRIVLVGDAAGYFDPLTGQGIHRALRSATLAAAGLDEHLCGQGWSPLDPADLRAPRAYARAYARSFVRGRLLQRGIEAVVGRDAARRTALDALAFFPALTSAVVRCTGDRPTTVFQRPTPFEPERNAND